MKTKTTSSYSRPFRLLSLALIGAFLCQDLGWAAPEARHPDFARFAVPEDVGIIKETHRPDKPASSEMLFNIKDVHDNFSAQESIVSILENLVRNYDVRTIGIEGTAGATDVSLLSLFADENARRTAATQLMKEGRLSAGEFFAAAHSGNVVLYGIDDEALYRENLESFKLAMASRDENMRMVKSLSEALRSLEEKILSPELLDLNRNGVLDVNGKVKFTDRWKRVSDLAAKHDVTADTYPNIQKLVGSIAREKAIDMAKANAEREKLMDALAKRLKGEKLEALIREGVSYRMGRVSQGSFSSYLLAAGKEAGADLSKYPNLKAYSEYILTYESVDLEAMRDEVRRFEDEIREKIYRNNTERRLHRLREQADILSDIFEIKLTTASLKEFQTHRETFTAAAFKDFIRENAGKNGLSPDAEKAIDGLFDKLPGVTVFYEAAEKRNQAMLSNMVKKMRESGQTVGCLVTGGFHSRGIADLLREGRTPYIVILPRFQKDASRPYVTILTNAESSYRAFAESAFANETRDRAAAYLFASMAHNLSEKYPKLDRRMLNEKIAVEARRMKTAYSGPTSAKPPAAMASKRPNPTPAVAPNFLAPPSVPLTPRGVQNVQVLKAADGSVLVSVGSVVHEVRFRSDRSIESSTVLTGAQALARWTREGGARLIDQRQDAIISSLGLDIRTRAEHDEINRDGVEAPLRAIGARLGVAGTGGLLDFRSWVMAQAGQPDTVSVNGWTIVRRDGISVGVTDRGELVIVHPSLRNHAGRTTNAVYASSEQMACHELAELRILQAGYMKHFSLTDVRQIYQAAEGRPSIRDWVQNALSMSAEAESGVDAVEMVRLLTFADSAATGIFGGVAQDGSEFSQLSSNGQTLEVLIKQATLEDLSGPEAVYYIASMEDIARQGVHHEHVDSVISATGVGAASIRIALALQLHQAVPPYAGVLVPARQAQTEQVEQTSVPAAPTPAQTVQAEAPAQILQAQEQSQTLIAPVASAPELGLALKLEEAIRENRLIDAQRLLEEMAGREISLALADKIAQLKQELLNFQLTPSELHEAYELAKDSVRLDQMRAFLAGDDLSLVMTTADGREVLVRRDAARIVVKRMDVAAARDRVNAALAAGAAETQKLADLLNSTQEELIVTVTVNGQDRLISRDALTLAMIEGTSTVADELVAQALGRSAVAGIFATLAAEDADVLTIEGRLVHRQALAQAAEPHRVRGEQETLTGALEAMVRAGARSTSVYSKPEVQALILKALEAIRTAVKEADRLKADDLLLDLFEKYLESDNGWLVQSLNATLKDTLVRERANLEKRLAVRDGLLLQKMEKTMTPKLLNAMTAAVVAATGTYERLRINVDGTLYSRLAVLELVLRLDKTMLQPMVDDLKGQVAADGQPSSLTSLRKRFESEKEAFRKTRKEAKARGEAARDKFLFRIGDRVYHSDAVEEILAVVFSDDTQLEQLTERLDSIASITAPAGTAPETFALARDVETARTNLELAELNMSLGRQSASEVSAARSALSRAESALAAKGKDGEQASVSFLAALYGVNRDSLLIARARMDEGKGRLIDALETLQEAAVGVVSPTVESPFTFASFRNGDVPRDDSAKVNQIAYSLFERLVQRSPNQSRLSEALANRDATKVPTFFGPLRDEAEHIFTAFIFQRATGFYFMSKQLIALSRIRDFNLSAGTGTGKTYVEFAAAAQQIAAMRSGRRTIDRGVVILNVPNPAIAEQFRTDKAAEKFVAMMAGNAGLEEADQTRLVDGKMELLEAVQKNLSEEPILAQMNKLNIVIIDMQSAGFLRQTSRTLGNQISRRLEHTIEYIDEGDALYTNLSDYVGSVSRREKEGQELTPKEAETLRLDKARRQEAMDQNELRIKATNNLLQGMDVNGGRTQRIDLENRSIDVWTNDAGIEVTTDWEYFHDNYISQGKPLIYLNLATREVLINEGMVELFRREPLLKKGSSDDRGRQLDGLDRGHLQTVVAVQLLDQGQVEGFRHITFDAQNNRYVFVASGQLRGNQIPGDLQLLQALNARRLKLKVVAAPEFSKVEVLSTSGGVSGFEIFRKVGRTRAEMTALARQAGKQTADEIKQWIRDNESFIRMASATQGEVVEFGFLMQGVGVFDVDTFSEYKRSVGFNLWAALTAKNKMFTSGNGAYAASDRFDTAVRSSFEEKIEFLKKQVDDWAAGTVGAKDEDGNIIPNSSLLISFGEMDGRLREALAQHIDARELGHMLEEINGLRQNDSEDVDKIVKNVQRDRRIIFTDLVGTRGNDYQADLYIVNVNQSMSGGEMMQLFGRGGRFNSVDGGYFAVGWVNVVDQNVIGSMLNDFFQMSETMTNFFTQSPFFTQETKNLFTKLSKMSRSEAFDYLTRQDAQGRLVNALDCMVFQSELNLVQKKFQAMQRLWSAGLMYVAVTQHIVAVLEEARKDPKANARLITVLEKMNNEIFVKDGNTSSTERVHVSNTAGTPIQIAQQTLEGVVSRAQDLFQRYIGDGVAITSNPDFIRKLTDASNAVEKLSGTRLNPEQRPLPGIHAGNATTLEEMVSLHTLFETAFAPSTTTSERPSQQLAQIAAEQRAAGADRITADQVVAISGDEAQIAAIVPAIGYMLSHYHSGNSYKEQHQAVMEMVAKIKNEFVREQLALILRLMTRNDRGDARLVTLARDELNNYFERNRMGFFIYARVTGTGKTLFSIYRTPKDPAKARFTKRVNLGAGGTKDIDAIFLERIDGMPDALDASVNVAESSGRGIFVPIFVAKIRENVRDEMLDKALGRIEAILAQILEDFKDVKARQAAAGKNSIEDPYQMRGRYIRVSAEGYLSYTWEEDREQLEAEIRADFGADNLTQSQINLLVEKKGQHILGLVHQINQSLTGERDKLEIKKGDTVAETKVVADKIKALQEDAKFRRKMFEKALGADRFAELVKDPRALLEALTQAEMDMLTVHEFTHEIHALTEEGYSSLEGREKEYVSHLVSMLAKNGIMALEQIYGYHSTAPNTDGWKQDYKIPTLALLLDLAAHFDITTNLESNVEKFTQAEPIKQKNLKEMRRIIELLVPKLANKEKFLVAVNALLEKAGHPLDVSSLLDGAPAVEAVEPSFRAQAPSSAAQADVDATAAEILPELQAQWDGEWKNLPDDLKAAGSPLRRLLAAWLPPDDEEPQIDAALKTMANTLARELEAQAIKRGDVKNYFANLIRNAAVVARNVDWDVTESAAFRQQVSQADTMVNRVFDEAEEDLAAGARIGRSDAGYTSIAGRAFALRSGTAIDASVLKQVGNAFGIVIARTGDTMGDDLVDGALAINAAPKLRDSLLPWMFQRAAGERAYLRYAREIRETVGSSASQRAVARATAKALTRQVSDRALAAAFFTGDPAAVSDVVIGSELEAMVTDQAIAAALFPALEKHIEEMIKKKQYAPFARQLQQALQLVAGDRKKPLAGLKKAVDYLARIKSENAGKPGVELFPTAADIVFMPIGSSAKPKSLGAWLNELAEAVEIKEGGKRLARVIEILGTGVSQKIIFNGEPKLLTQWGTDMAALPLRDGLRATVTRSTTTVEVDTFEGRRLFPTESRKSGKADITLGQIRSQIEASLDKVFAKFTALEGSADIRSFLKENFDYDLDVAAEKAMREIYDQGVAPSTALDEIRADFLTMASAVSKRDPEYKNQAVYKTALETAQQGLDDVLETARARAVQEGRPDDARFMVTPNLGKRLIPIRFDAWTDLDVAVPDNNGKISYQRVSRGTKEITLWGVDVVLLPADPLITVNQLTGLLLHESGHLGADFHKRDRREGIAEMRARQILRALPNGEAALREYLGIAESGSSRGLYADEVAAAEKEFGAVDPVLIDLARFTGNPAWLAPPSPTRFERSDYRLAALKAEEAISADETEYDNAIKALGEEKDPAAHAPLYEKAIAALKRIEAIDADFLTFRSGDKVITLSEQITRLEAQKQQSLKLAELAEVQALAGEYDRAMEALIAMAPLTDADPVEKIASWLGQTEALLREAVTALQKIAAIDSNGLTFSGKDEAGAVTKITLAERIQQLETRLANIAEDRETLRGIESPTPTGLSESIQPPSVVSGTRPNPLSGPILPDAPAAPLVAAPDAAETPPTPGNVTPVTEPPVSVPEDEVAVLRREIEALEITPSEAQRTMARLRSQNKLLPEADAELKALLKRLAPEFKRKSEEEQQKETARAALAQQNFEAIQRQLVKGRFDGTVFVDEAGNIVEIKDRFSAPQEDRQGVFRVYVMVDIKERQWDMSGQLEDLDADLQVLTPERGKVWGRVRVLVEDFVANSIYQEPTPPQAARLTATTDADDKAVAFQALQESYDPADAVAFSRELSAVIEPELRIIADATKNLKKGKVSESQETLRQIRAATETLTDRLRSAERGLSPTRQAYYASLYETGLLNNLTNATGIAQRFLEKPDVILTTDTINTFRVTLAFAVRAHVLMKMFQRDAQGGLVNGRTYAYVDVNRPQNELLDSLRPEDDFGGYLTPESASVELLYLALNNLPFEMRAEYWYAKVNAKKVFRVLVVDDDPMVRELTVEYVDGLLKRIPGMPAEGVAVEFVSNVPDGFERWQAGSYDLVITDRNFEKDQPDHTGTELVARIRKAESGIAAAERTPILMTTGDADAVEDNIRTLEDSEFKADASNFNLLIMDKPYSEEKFRLALNRILPKDTQIAPYEKPAPAAEAAGLKTIVLEAKADWTEADETVIGSIVSIEGGMVQFTLLDLTESKGAEKHAPMNIVDFTAKMQALGYQVLSEKPASPPTVGSQWPVGAKYEKDATGTVNGTVVMVIGAEELATGISYTLQPLLGGENIVLDEAKMLQKFGARLSAASPSNLDGLKIAADIDDLGTNFSRSKQFWRGVIQGNLSADETFMGATAEWYGGAPTGGLEPFRAAVLQNAREKLIWSLGRQLRVVYPDSIDPAAIDAFLGWKADTALRQEILASYEFPAPQTIEAGDLIGLTSNANATRPVWNDELDAQFVHSFRPLKSLAAADLDKALIDHASSLGPDIEAQRIAVVARFEDGTRKAAFLAHDGGILHVSNFRDVPAFTALFQRRDPSLGQLTAGPLAGAVMIELVRSIHVHPAPPGSPRKSYPLNRVDLISAANSFVSVTQDVPPVLTSQVGMVSLNTDSATNTEGVQRTVSQLVYSQETLRKTSLQAWQARDIGIRAALELDRLEKTVPKVFAAGESAVAIELPQGGRLSESGLPDPYATPRYSEADYDPYRVLSPQITTAKVNAFILRIAGELSNAALILGDALGANNDFKNLIGVEFDLKPVPAEMARWFEGQIEKAFVRNVVRDISLDADLGVLAEIDESQAALFMNRRYLNGADLPPLTNSAEIVLAVRDAFNASGARFAAPIAIAVVLPETDTRTLDLLSERFPQARFSAISSGEEAEGLSGYVINLPGADAQTLANAIREAIRLDARESVSAILDAIEREDLDRAGLQAQLAQLRVILPLFETMDPDALISGDIQIPQQVSAAFTAAEAKRLAQIKTAHRQDVAGQIRTLVQTNLLQNTAALPLESVLSADGKTLAPEFADILARTEGSLKGRVLLYTFDAAKAAQFKTGGVSVAALDRNKNVLEQLKDLPEAAGRPVSLLFGSNEQVLVEPLLKPGGEDRFIYASPSAGAAQRLVLALVAETKSQKFLLAGDPKDEFFVQLREKYGQSSWVLPILLPFRLMEELQKALYALRATGAAA